MKNKNKKYTKDDSTRELFTPKETIDKTIKEIESVQKHEKVHSSYTKPEADRLPFAFIAIISGGEKREKDYFAILSHQDKFKRLKLEFIADASKLNPIGMFEIAETLNIRLKESKGFEEEPDEIYLISDFDHFLEDLQKIKQECIDKGYHLIISNPCFEIWLYYALCESKPIMTLPENQLKISGKFKKWVNHKVPGGIKPRKAIFQIHENIKNAQLNYAELEPGIPDIFATNMYLLAERLILFIEPELDEWIYKNKEIERKFRSGK